MEATSNRTRQDFEELLLDYAMQVLQVANELPDTRAGNYVAQQLLAAAASPMRSHAEARAAGSLKGFIDKMTATLTNLRECYRWLTIVQKFPLVSKPASLDPVLQDGEKLIKLFFSSVRTATERQEERERGQQDRATGRFSKA
ncbi:MAG: four helix bundle protein [Planctomycetes bacterium]|nr:four helix bundle protein [Planctomycetota bacterium]